MLLLTNLMSFAISNNVPIYLCENVMCRLCGCTGNNMSFIMLKESCYLVKVIQNETSVKIRDVDIFPKTVCRGCVDKIQVIQHFKAHCRKTQKVLEKMYKSKTTTDKIDLANVNALSAVQTTCDNEDDSEMIVEWLDEEFSNYNIINNQNEQLEESGINISDNLLSNNNGSKYGVMYKDTTTFKSVHITVQDQNLPENATIVPSKILGQTVKPRVQTYSKEELSKLSTNITETNNIEEVFAGDNLEEPIIEDNTYIKLNDPEANCPLLFRLLTTNIQPKTIEEPTPNIIVRKKTEDTSENNNIVSKQSPVDDISSDKRIDRSGRVFISNSHKYVKKLLNKEYSCTICNAKFRYPFKAELHVRKHTGELPFKCKVCGKSFITGFYLLKHEKTHAVGQFTCEVCGKNFRQSYGLKDHQRIHTDAPSFKCEHCGKEFFTKGNFDTHKVIHGEKKHICEICGKRFYLHAMMKRHQNRHTNKTFQCQLCPKLSKTKEEYMQHKKRHEKNGLYRCATCSLSFWSKKGLQMHERARHQNELNSETTETSTAINNVITENIEFIYTDF